MIAALTLGVLFYNSLTAGGILFFLLLPLIRMEKERLRRKRECHLKRQFRDGMQAMASALSAGYSAENAFVQARVELQRIYGAEALLSAEFSLICRKMEMNFPVEGLLRDLAERSGLPDVREFSEVFAIIKQNGGPLSQILRGVTNTMAEKGEAEDEIRTLMTGKRLEFAAMCFLPALMLVYVRLGNPGFLDPVYSGIRGRIFMTVCLVVYAFAIWLGQKMVRVEV